VVSKIDKIEAQMREAPTNVRYGDLHKVCTHHFGEPRQEGTSHANSKRRGPATLG
jgi:hypothetical protein